MNVLGFTGKLFDSEKANVKNMEESEQYRALRRNGKNNTTSDNVVKCTKTNVPEVGRVHFTIGG